MTESEAKMLETTFVQVITMEEVPVLSDEERAELIASLKEGQADIAAGRFVKLGAGEIGPWLDGIMGEARLKK